MVMLRGTGRGGPQALPGRGSLQGRLPGGGRGRTTAEGADGTSECPGVSTHERGDAGAISQPWDIQQAEKSIRVRNAGESRVRGLGPGPIHFQIAHDHHPLTFDFEIDERVRRHEARGIVQIRVMLAGGDTGKLVSRTLR